MQAVGPAVGIVSRRGTWGKEGRTEQVSKKGQVREGRGPLSHKFSDLSTEGEGNDMICKDLVAKDTSHMTGECLERVMERKKKEKGTSIT
jgi:hypothetical protein